MENEGQHCAPRTVALAAKVVHDQGLSGWSSGLRHTPGPDRGPVHRPTAEKPGRSSHTGGVQVCEALIGHENLVRNHSGDD